MKNVPSDRASVIEDALTSFEWLYRVAIWVAFGLAGFSFLFWSGLTLHSKNLLSFATLCACTFPLRQQKPFWEFVKGFAVVGALVGHMLTLQGDFNGLPSVLLIIPAFLAAEIFSGWLMRAFFIAAVWGVHIYWVYGFIPEPQKLMSSALGALVTCSLLLLFQALQRAGKQIAAKKLEGLRGRNDFNSQRIHASRLQILGELSAALVHELSNPVTNLQGFFLQLRDAEEFRLSTKWRDVLGRIDANLMRVRDLLLGFRSFSRMTPTQNSEFKVSELFKDLDVLSRHAFTAQKIQLSIEAMDIDVEVLGNRVEIGQIVMNFLLNALSAVKDSEDKKVRLGCYYRGENVAIFVEDSGPGVDADLKDKIFRPFFSTKGDEGSGLGLYISKLIADNHGCQIEVNRAELKDFGGARFELILPPTRYIKKDLAA